MRVVATVLAVIAFLLAVKAGRRALRGVSRDAAALGAAVRIMNGQPIGDDPLVDKYWMIADHADRAAGALGVIAKVLQSGQDDLRQGAWLGLAAAATATASAIVAIWL